MGRDISIAVSAKDNYTQVITTMRNANQHFNKDLEGLTQRLKTLDSTRVNLKIETSQLRRELQAAQRQFNETGSAADKMILELAESNFENANRNLRLVSQNARAAEKDIINLTDAVSRSNNRVGGVISNEKNGGLASALATAGLGKMVGDALSGAVNVGISSAFGDTVGNAISTTLSGTLSGASIGSMAGGVPGAVAGAVVGTVAGGINAASGVFQKDEVAYKDVRQQLTTDAWVKQDEDLQKGISIAAARETSLTSFSTLFGGMEAAQAYLDQLIVLANETPFLYDDLTALSKTLKTYKYDVDELIPQMTMIGDTGAALGMDTASMDMVATVLGRMHSTDRVTAEYINSLQARGIQATDFLAKDSGKTEKEVAAGISKGEISGKDAAAVISHYLRELYSGSMEQQAKTFAGLSSTIEGLNEELLNAMGEGFMEVRMPGMEEQRAWLEGDSAEDMKEANHLLGEWQGHLKNEQERLRREHLDAAMEQIKEAGLTGAEAGYIIAKAEAEAKAAYNASEGAQLQVEMQRSLIEQVGKTLADDPATYMSGRIVGDAYSKGIVDATRDRVQELSQMGEWMGGHYGPSMWEDAEEDEEPITISIKKGSAANRDTKSPGGFAFGIPYVPYDDYIVRLHEGERVLTAQQARQSDNSSAGPQIQVGGTYYVREEQDIDKIARALAKEIAKAKMISRGH